MISVLCIFAFIISSEMPFDAARRPPPMRHKNCGPEGITTTMCCDVIVYNAVTQQCTSVLQCCTIYSDACTDTNLLSLLHGYLDISCVLIICRCKAQHSTADETEDKGKEGGDYQVPHSTVEAAWASHGL